MKVCIIGDVVIDRYIYGSVERLSPEAPIPIIKHESRDEALGGAGNLYQNLINLDIDVDSLLHLSFPRSVKTRIICGKTHMARIDDDKFSDGDEVLELIRHINFSRYDYVILSDYDKGVAKHSREIIKHISAFGCRVIVDPKKDASEYEGAWLVKPNASEYDKFGFKDWKSNIIKTSAGDKVEARIDGITYTIDVDKADVSDVTGAGDCFLAAFVYGLTKKYSYKECLELAVRGATKSVEYVGTYVLNKKDIETVVFTNGCFDILHPGHMNFLQDARKLGTKLIVGLNTDESIKRIKGESRPINDTQTRINNLLRLGLADEIRVFNEDTPYELIKKIQPDIIVKGGDYTPDQVVGNDLAEVVILPYLEGFSTTAILEKVNAAKR
jgi:D-beta-D-heptose 7-phosphate kinase/D-beta-D-heptose 1-phosphate adenosyltransferase